MHNKIEFPTEHVNTKNVIVIKWITFNILISFQIFIIRTHWLRGCGGWDGGPLKCRFYNFSALSLHSTSTISIKFTSTRKGVNLQSTNNLHGKIKRHISMYMEPPLMYWILFKTKFHWQIYKKIGLLVNNLNALDVQI